MPEADAAPLEPLGLPRLLWGMVIRPRTTLEYLNEHGKRDWWLPAVLALLLVVLPILVGAPVTARERRETVQAAQERMGGQFGTDMSAEQEAQMEQAMSRAASPLITTVFPAVGGVVWRAVVWLVWAGALYLAGTALGGRSAFGQMFRMVVWVWLPYALRGLLQTIYILVSGQLIANPGLSGFVWDNRTVGDAMLFTPPSPGQMLLAALLSHVDVYLFWNLALLVIGVMVTTRLPRRKAVLVTLGMWILLTAIGLLPALVGGLAAQQVGFVG